MALCAAATLVGWHLSGLAVRFHLPATSRFARVSTFLVAMSAALIALAAMLDLSGAARLAGWARSYGITQVPVALGVLGIWLTVRQLRRLLREALEVGRDLPDCAGQ
jgi:hypothetical protein